MLRGNDETHRAVEVPRPVAMEHIRIILVEPQFGGNIGACARAMKTAGITDLALVRPAASPDGDEARTLASGARELLEKSLVVETLDAAVEGLHWLVGTTNRRRGGMLENPVPLREAAGRIVGIARDQRIGILFGREDFGLSSDDLSRCNFSVAIPVARGMPPLNLSHAVQVVAQELLLAATGEVETPPLALASVSEVEALLGRFGELLETVDQDTLTHPPEKVLASLRRAFSRIGLEPRDVRTLHMVLRAATTTIDRRGEGKG